VVGDPIVSPPRDSGVVPREQVEELTIRLRDGLQAVFDEANAERQRSRPDGRRSASDP
jgi:hypothetical protein